MYRSIDNDGNNVSSESQPKKKKKNKKKKAKESEEQTKDASADKNGSASSPEQIQGSSKSSQVRTYPNGLVVEEVAMGKPDGKKAAPGKKVTSFPHLLICLTTITCVKVLAHIFFM